jgi:hypothetical protein
MYVLVINFLFLNDRCYLAFSIVGDNFCKDVSIHNLLGADAIDKMPG